MTLTLCCSLIRIPIQVTDSLIPILDAQNTPSIAVAIAKSSGSTGYLRPFRIGQIQALFEAAHGHYVLAYRGFHVALAIACIALFVLALDVRTPSSLVVLPFALTVLTGLHTFRGTMWEAFPINHFLEIVVCCLLAFVLAQSKGGWWVDVAGALVFLFASLTLESGLLVWVVMVAGRLTGLRGFSRQGIVVVTALLVGYLYVRFAYLGAGAPDLSERSTGFGLDRLDTDELTRRFGGWPYGFYAYNVASSFLTVLFAEPRAGVWTIPAEFIRGRIAIGTWLNVVSSCLTTLLIAWFVARRMPAWREHRFDHADQIVVVGFAVLVANAILSYAYTKDEIMSPAGAFYSLAAFVAVRDVLAWAGQTPRHRRALAILGTVLAISATGWLIRAAGLHYHMHTIAFSDRNEWVDVDGWLQRQQSAPTTEEGRRLVETLKNDALNSPSPNAYLVSPLLLPRLAQIFR